MNYVTPIVGIILAFSWCIFLLNEQRDEIRHWKAQAQIAVSHHNTKNHELIQCTNDVDYLKAILEKQ